MKLFILGLVAVAVTANASPTYVPVVEYDKEVQISIRNCVEYKMYSKDPSQLALACVHSMKLPNGTQFRGALKDSQAKAYYTYTSRRGWSGQLIEETANESYMMIFVIFESREQLYAQGYKMRFLFRGPNPEPEAP